MRLVHPHAGASVKGARAGFTIMEVLLALSLTVVIIGLLFGGVVAFTRANTAASTFEGLNVTAKVLEDQLKQDLVHISRTRTFNGNCPRTVTRTITTSNGPEPASGVRLELLNPVSGAPFRVDYVTPPSGALYRISEEGGAGATVDKAFFGVEDFYIGCLTGGQVTATAVVREQLNAGDRAGQVVEVRVSSAVRMR